MSFELRTYKLGSADYELALRLRTRVLRDPLGLKFDPQDLAKETDDVHLGAFAGERVLGSLILTRLNARSVKMRQVAVDAESQRQGIGRRLVQRSEELAREAGYDEIVLNARDTAIPFYTALGYVTVGEPFTEIGIPHRKMTKAL